MSSEDRDYALREREVIVKEAEVELKKREAAFARRTNPLATAVLVAAIAGFGNAIVSWWNGRLENQRSETALVLEVIKTSNLTQAAQNLEFVIDVGLLSRPDISERIRVKLAQLKPGTGPVLPAPFPTYSTGTTIPDATYSADAPLPTGRK